MHDLIVIGAGTAGMAAGLEAASLKLKTLVICEAVADFPKQPKGVWPDAGGLKKHFLAALKQQAHYLQLLNGQKVISLEKNVVSFSVELSSGRLYYSRAVILATGRDPKTGEGNTGFELLTVKDVQGRIKIDSRQATNIPGIFAAGGVVEGQTFQNILVSAGEGTKAAVSVQRFLKGEI